MKLILIVTVSPPILIGLRTSEEQLDTILDNLDRNKDGLISKREFLKVFLAGHQAQSCTN